MVLKCVYELVYLLWEDFVCGCFEVFVDEGGVPSYKREKQCGIFIGLLLASLNNFSEVEYARIFEEFEYVQV